MACGTGYGLFFAALNVAVGHGGGKETEAQCQDQNQSLSASGQKRINAPWKFDFLICHDAWHTVSGSGQGIKSC
jgi:hypothetical protein